MKKVSLILLTVLAVTLCFTGCAFRDGSRQDRTVRVYSVSGEDDRMTVSNGIIVLNGENDICYGGDLRINQEESADITAYTVTVYFDTNNDKKVLISDGVKDLTGGTIKKSFDIGKTSGNIIKDSEIDKLTDHLWVELTTTDTTGESNTTRLQLKMTEIVR